MRVGEQTTGATSPSSGAVDCGMERRLPGNLRDPRASNFEWKRSGEGNEAAVGQRKSERVTVPMKSEKSPQASRWRERPAKQINRRRER